MFVSNVEVGLRLAMPTIVCAARCMTVSISYSPSTRSISAASQRSPRTTLTRSSCPDVTSSDCGIQSRTRQSTSAPASTSRRTSQLPTSPVAPVTNVGLSRQNVSDIRKHLGGLIGPDGPGGLVPRPEVVEIEVLAIGVHRVKETLVLVGDELAVMGQLLERLALQNAVRVDVEVVEHPALEDEETGVDPPFDLRFLGKVDDAAVRS